MMDRQKIIADMQRVSKLLDSKSVSQSDFEKYGEISVSGVAYVFGSWNRAVLAAGLEPYGAGKRKDQRRTSDAELMEEIVRLTVKLGKRPSDREMSSFGRFSPKPFAKRWGSFVKGREAAYELLGFPLHNDALMK